MSRSLGAMSLTTSPSIWSSPSLMSSSPAIIRSAVDFPQPEGPTRIMNSPSAISRSMSLTASKPSPNRFQTPFMTISAIATLLTLDGACGQPGDDAALEEQDEDDDRDRHDHGRRGDVPGRLSELGRPGEERQGGGHGPRCVGRRQRDCEQEV